MIVFLSYDSYGDCKININGRVYLYHGVSRYHFERCRDYASKGWDGKVMQILKLYTSKETTNGKP